MKVSVQKVKNLKESGIIDGYKKVIREANASKDSKRMAAAIYVQESVDRLEVFISDCVTWETKKGNYIIPKSRKEDFRKVRLFIGHETLVSKVLNRRVYKDRRPINGHHRKR